MKSSAHQTCDSAHEKKSPAHLCLNCVTPALRVQGFHSHLNGVARLFFHSVCNMLDNQAESYICHYAGTENIKSYNEVNDSSISKKKSSVVFHTGHKIPSCHVHGQLSRSFLLLLEALSRNVLFKIVKSNSTKN